MANPFDQFDAPQGSGNPFDQFDGPSGGMPHIGALTTNGALSALQGARADLERQIAHMNPQQQAMARQQFEANPQIQAIKAKTVPTPQANNGFMALGNSYARGTTAGWADKLEAGIAAPINYAIDHIRGTGPRANLSLGDEYQQAKDYALGQAHADEQAHPLLTTAGTVGGAVTLGAMTGGAGETAAAPEVAAQAPGLLARGANVIRSVAPDVAYGASYNAGQSNADTWGGEGKDALIGAGEGLAGHVAGKVVGAVAGGVADPVKQALYNQGVRFTPGQALGGVWQSLENKFTSLPMAGSMIDGRLADAGKQWNVATLNRALEPYGATIPDGMTGSDAFAYGQKAVDNAFNQARSGLQVAKNEDFNTALGELQNRVTDGGVEALPESLQKQFANVVQNNVLRKFNEDGVMTPQAYTKATSDLRSAARKQMAGNNPADAQDYGKALNDLADILDNAALNNPASDPAAVQQLQKAREGYRLWALAQGAADRGGSGTAGQFTPAQYLQEVEKGDTSVRNHLFTEGKAFDQQYGQQALNALGSRLPNSFTADRVLANQLLTESVPAAAAGLFHPSGVVQAAALTPLALDLTGSALYSKPVNALANKIMFGGGTGRAVAGKVGNAFGRQLGRAAAPSVLAIQNAAK